MRHVHIPYPVCPNCPECGKDNGCLQSPVGGMERLACDVCGYEGPLAPVSISLVEGEWGVLAALAWTEQIEKARTECAA
jgi:hypothetical protein